MRISRLYQPVILTCGEVIELDDENAHYVRTVLRLKKGAEIILFNGQGGEYLASILEAHRKRVVIEIIEWRDKNFESPLKVAFGLAISRASRMDFAIQKAVELGVNIITPLLTERTVVKLNEDTQQQKYRHWHKIAQHASEQCGRTEFPLIKSTAALSDWMEKQSGLKIFLDPKADNKLPKLKPEQHQITLLSGPEGGFSEQERVLAKGSGFIPVKMGPRVLRSETAALAALAAVQTLWGDYG